MTNVEEKKGLFKLKPKNSNKHKKGFKMWSAFSILMLIIVVLVLLSWILKWAGVETTVHIPGAWENGKEGGTWIAAHDNVEKIKALGILDIFVGPMNGFLEKAGIIVFVLTLGAFINMVIVTKSLEGFSQSIIAKLKGKEIWAIIPLMIFFSIAGTAEGMAEESLAFYMIMIPLMIAAGFDTFTGLLIVLVGAGAGVLASTVNPFVISVAVDGLNTGQTTDLMSVGDGLVWRLISWVVITAIAIGFVFWYAKRVKSNPQKSVTFATREGDKEFFLANVTEKIEMNWRKKTTLAFFGVTFLFMIIYLVGWDKIFGNTAMEDMANWIHVNIPYLNSTIPGFGNGGLEIVAGFFLIGALAVGMINTIGVKKEEGQTAETMILKDFMGGAADILSVCLIIATAAGIGFVLKNSHMQEWVVSGLTGSIGSIDSGIGKVIVLYIIFLPLSFLIPSTSGFAAAVFPLLTGIAQNKTGGGFDPVVGSGSVMAFSFASGIINIITPTSGVVMGAMAISRVDYGKFLKGVAPLLGILLVASIALMAIGGAIAGVAGSIA
ncbi:arginine/ornithine antiporter [Williamsoniiplasma luminosum]|uniref:Arginine/ornithine antiporter n=1 Tax=Williamsoniiplasma luminosum TaxID=214888 RepID=A0A2K8NSY2_9MOLU|nr:YfcC family protein [Williamsoniiplasma luminosum]ATZ16952.1 arginine/ornithine antiporter [Williamsoniiplasma luminosum]